MKTLHALLTVFVIGILIISCSTGGGQSESAAASDATVAAADGGQSNVKDDVSQKDVVRIAAGSADHTTLVTALKTAEYLDELSNAGPFTVFAPTNAAFDKLPAGTVEGLLKPESKDALRNILEYHVAVGVYKLDYLRDGQTINQANLDNVTIGVKDGQYTVNGANIVATIPASNGVIYIVDAVLLPPAK
jgi:uncharacterized surface protein with fasciclin (FAS1) repeats